MSTAPNPTEDRPPQAPPPTSAPSKAMASKPRELTAHPLADIFPPVVNGDDFRAFIKDIEVNGQREEIVTLGDEILDGRRRYEACRLLQRPTRTREFDPSRDGKTPRDFVLSMNVHRRHLNASQRAIIAAKLATLKVGDNQHS
jgi:hypothetical protein